VSSLYLGLAPRLTLRNFKTRELLIVPESTLSLVQREFLIGDIVKRSLANVESAVVVEVKSEVRLEHVMSKIKVEDWIPYDLIKSAIILEARDKVIYDEWIGTVEEVSRMTIWQVVADMQVFEDGIVEGFAGRQMYRIAEMGGFMTPGAVLAVSRFTYRSGHGLM
jgi:ubiquitin-conjugating enzyme E2 O